MSLFGRNPLEPIVAAYEKLLTAERAHHADEAERWRKERAELIGQLMVLTNPKAVAQARGGRRAPEDGELVGIIHEGGPSRPLMGMELPEEFADAAMPVVRRPQNAGAVVAAISRADEMRARIDASKRRETAAPPPPAEPQPS